MVEDNQTFKEGQFNQAIAQQQRLHTLFSEIDIRSVHMFRYDNAVQEWNYNLVFNCLNTVFLTISANLTGAEQQKLLEKRKVVRLILRIKKPYQEYKSAKIGGGYNSGRNEDYEAQDLITDSLLEFRLAIETAMDAHGLSNPSKTDVTKSMVKL